MRIRHAGVLAAAAVSCLVLGACSAGSLGSSDSAGGGKTSLNFLVDNGDQTVAIANQLVKDFTAKNPDITIKVNTRPAGSDGDNLVKTRLSTSSMDDIFEYNSGSLFQALAPEKNLTPLNDRSWVSQLDPNFKTTVTANNQVYGAPWGTFIAGAVLYNKAVYDKLGLKVPTSWAEFMSNSAKIKASGVDPVIQSYGDTWTSQLFVLGDFHNVAAADPSFAQDYTNNKAKYATTPAALAGFTHQQAVHDAGYENKDYASTKYDDALGKLAKGEGAQYPILSSAVAQIVANFPDQAKDIGLFALPGDNAATNGLTVWAPAGVYIPKTTTGAKLDAAKKFADFIASPDGCASQTKASSPVGPYANKTCTLPGDVTQVAKDTQAYLDKPNGSSLALEFLSPIKGPALEQITVEVGSGIRKAPAAAALYDQDVKKQAQQLGLPGW
jgi:raffinose/stachyose/melibiose transport system substrate-binding protein